MNVTLTKLGHRKDPRYSEGISNVLTNDAFVGIEDAPPKVGQSYLLWCGGRFQYVHTSVVMSLYVHESEEGYDKLVLPSGFPDVLHVEIPELKKGDTLLATMNSVYLVRKLPSEDC